MIENILKKEYENLIRKPNEVLTIFSNFYGEDKVDLQGLPSLEEFVESGSQNIVEFAHHYLFFNDLQREYFDKNGCNNSEMDYTFNNQEVFELFYKDFIMYHIDKGIFSNINILVYIPEVTVTNEHNKSILLKKFYVKVPLTVRGLFKGGALYFNRAEYTPAQIKSAYMHSHINSITYDRLNKFKGSCLGSGPIRDTILMLNTEYDEDRWVLLCLELSKYLEVESLNGGPYMNLENVTDRSGTETFKDFKLEYNISNLLKRKYSSRIALFLKHLISSNKLTFNYFNGSYNIAMNFVDFNVLISNEFIKWWNEVYDSPLPREDFAVLLRDGLLKKAILGVNSISIKGDMDNNLQNIIRTVERQICCTFKGQEIPIRVISNSNEEHDVLILNPQIIQSIYTKILILININYGTRTETTDSRTGSKTTSYRVQGNSKTLLINH